MISEEIETGIGTAIGLHVMTSSSLFTILSDLVGPQYFTDDLINEKFEIKNSYIKLPKGMGISVGLNEDKLKRYMIAKS